MYQRAANNYEKYRVSFSQAQNKFKKLVSKCKFVRLTQRTASGIARYQVEKGYGKWWDILFLLVASRESWEPKNMIEPSLDAIYQRVESKTHPNEVSNVSSQNRKANTKKQKEKKLEPEIVNLTRSFIENYPTEKLINFWLAKTKGREGTSQKCCRWCFRSIILFITIKLRICISNRIHLFCNNQ